MPARFLDRVTATGADDSIDPKDLKRLQEEYPFVEWGILVSEAKIGGYRFPSEQWIAELCGDPTTTHGKELGPEAELNISVHLCGRYVRQLCKGEFTWLEQDWLKPLFAMAQRVQLNFHARVHRALDVAYLAKSLLSRWPEKQVICQVDGVNEHLVSGLYDEGCDVAALYDKSGGAGILPNTWPSPMNGIYSGYAGGLSPGNVQEELEKIYKVVEYVHGVPVWLDAETRLRTEDNSSFDIDKVYWYLSNAESWVRY